ncbi:hypothetical protein CDEST_13075 [Colletotrichum destructivum]|uniref:Uncharacterized protein n=1 Tax=Colletotrichum destructivum TaxID=34406 RepID=A0AAX4IXU7_9PEZI|nr:hypothetical protein CDEST_13075 [Colletotrichum destructivum]
MSYNGTLLQANSSSSSTILQRQVFNENDEDVKCHEHDHLHPPQNRETVRYNSYGSTCQGNIRVITCRPYDPPWAMFLPTMRSQIGCDKNYVCRQNGVRRTRFGTAMRPTTSCVQNPSLKVWVVGGREIGEKCCSKFTLQPAGTGRTVRFHEWAFNAVTGLYKQVKWMYVKVNGAYYKSAQTISDWTIEVPGIKGTDNLELCAFPLTGDELKVAAQFTVL